VRDGLIAMTLEVQFGDDLRAQKADRVGCDGVAVARVKLLRHRSAAQDSPAFDNKDVQPSLAEIGRRGQTIVATSHHDCIIGHR
jgi:hypothetical protein